MQCGTALASSVGMYHIVAKTELGLLFQTAEQAHQLWTRVVCACPGLEALCLMPNHAHLQHKRDLRIQLAQALRGHSRSLNHTQGRQGRRIAPLPAARWAADEQKRRRETRYIHLNPCRAKLVSDPLAWPWSSYRDALGLLAQPVRKVHGNPRSLHRYTSSDPSVSLTGTELPMRSDGDLFAIEAAVSAYLRVPLSNLRKRGPGRRLTIQTAKVCLEMGAVELAKELGVNAATVRRAPTQRDEAVRAIERLIGDPRFPGI
ncbi:MAG: hypothetical protein ACI9VR_000706 [Cognaticolwellia sp.]